jgi:hypothetical protein
VPTVDRHHLFVRFSVLGLDGKEDLRHLGRLQAAKEAEGASLRLRHITDLFEMRPVLMLLSGLLSLLNGVSGAFCASVRLCSRRSTISGHNRSAHCTSSRPLLLL